MFEVGKRYYESWRCSAPRVCLKVTQDYVLLDAQDLPHSRPLSVDRIHWFLWKEHKEPMKAEPIFLPVMLWHKAEKPIIYTDYARDTREKIQEYYQQNFQKSYKLLDIIEVTWQEKKVR